MATKAGTTAPSKKTGATKKAAPKGLVLHNGKATADVEAMAKALAIFGMATVPKKPAEVLMTLRQVLANKLKDLDSDAKVRCEACGEVGTDDTDFCPFCGDKGDVGEDEPEVVVEEAVVEGAAPESTSAAIAAADQQLQARIERIIRLKSDISGNSYDLGLEIVAIQTEQLWKARGHKSFKDFVEADLGMSRALAYRLMDVTQKHSREEFMVIGSTKLALISSIKDDEEREKVLEEARQGASTRTVEARARASKGKAPAAAKAAEAPPKKANEITLLAKVNGKATTYGWRSASTGRPLKEHKDDSYVELELAENVRQRIALKVDREGAILGVTVQFLRVEE
jgi:hypothetical protein